MIRTAICLAYHFLIAIACSRIAIAQSELAIEPESQTQSDFISQLWAYFFYFVFLPGVPIFLYLFIRRSGAMKQGVYLQRAEKHMELAETHMKAIEKQNMRIIELLEAVAESGNSTNR